MFYRYLKYGCAKPYPISKPNGYRNSSSLEQIKSSYDNIIKRSIEKIENPENGIFQLSGGFDSSLVVSYFNGVNTLCMEHQDSTDVHYSIKASMAFDTRHTVLNERQLLNDMDFKKAIIDMNYLHSYPRAFKNDIGLYTFIDFARDKYDFIVGGEGVEFQMLGYENIYSNLLNLAVALGQYDMNFARYHLYTRKCQSPLNSKIHYSNILDCRKNKPHFSELITWWSSNFTDDEIEEFGIEKEPLPELSSINEILHFIFEWYGKQYVIDRREEYLDGLKWYTPFLDDEFVKYTSTLPIELKNCMGYHKFAFYEAMHKRLPKEITERPKSGLMTDFSYYKDNYDNILYLVKEFMTSDCHIYDYLEYEACQKYIMNFRKEFNHDNFVKLWSLLNLSIWVELHEPKNGEI